MVEVSLKTAQEFSAAIADLVVQRDLARSALAEAEARGYARGLEEAATRCDEEATAVEAALAKELGLAVICVSPETRRLRRLRNDFRSLATAPAETQKPETGESDHG